MNIERAELADELARRYVLGTMRGAARRRFAALAGQHATIRRSIDAWEARLTPVAWSLPPVEPSELVWRRIVRELGFGQQATRSAAPVPWMAAAAAFAVLALGFGYAWWQSATRPPQVITETVVETVIEPLPERATIAFVSDDASRSLWLARLFPASQEIVVQVVTEPEQRADADYQLWLLTADGTPLSLGILPQSGEATLTMDPAAAAELPTSELVAVSLEPPGGSPQPVPTGPVLFTGTLLAP